MKRRRHFQFTLVTLIVTLLALVFSCQHQHHKLANHKKTKPQKITKKEIRNKLTTKKKKPTKLADFFTSQEKQNKTACPDKRSQKDKEPGELQKSKGNIEANDSDNRARLRFGVEVISFDIVYLEKSKLDIPSFKQFKNNMTDFTANGEIEFETIIAKIRKYLGENTDGSGVSLRIFGSASQIPTSFDPNLPNNNIQVDGSSIKGKTSVENNKKLARARALELAKKIEAIFVNIQIVTPSLDDIQIGQTPWTREVQKELDKAYLSDNKKRMQEIFEPFQKEQFVKVESDEIFIKTIQPKAVRMYTMIATPRIVQNDEEVKSRFVISKKTYLKLNEGPKGFDSPEKRELYLKKEGFHFRPVVINNELRWHLIHGHHEKHVLHHSDQYKRIVQSYEAGMVDKRDYATLEQILTEQELKAKRYKYIMKQRM